MHENREIAHFLLIRSFSHFSMKTAKSDKNHANSFFIDEAYFSQILGDYPRKPNKQCTGRRRRYTACGLNVLEQSSALHFHKPPSFYITQALLAHLINDRRLCLSQADCGIPPNTGLRPISLVNTWN